MAYKNQKYCKKCETDKPVAAYWKNKTTSDGLQAWCKPCWQALVDSKLTGDSREKYLRMRRNGNLLRAYGITADEYDVLLETQGNVCAICREYPYQHKKLAVDHDHATGRVRGILCENCNRGIGMFKDRPELLQSAIEYLS
tara:strand:+ start:59 stop:481 length:423 start_codon:yes stop_codon:yes gene_type:complete